MNYIKLINRFWDMHRRRSLERNEIALYFFLLNEANSFNWENPVRIKNALIQDGLGVSFNTLCDIRNKLQQTDLIRFKTTNGSKFTEYLIVNETSSNIDKVFDKVTNEVPDEVSAKVSDKVAVPSSLYNKHKPKLKVSESTLVLEPDEIKRRLKEEEYEVQEFICKQYQFSPELYCAAVDYFVDERTAGSNELAKAYSDVISHFKNWVKLNADRIKKNAAAGGTQIKKAIKEWGT